MLKLLSKKLRKNNKGFTLVELIAVVAILGILAAIAVPRFTVSRKKAAISAHEANVRTLINAANMYIVDYGLPSDENSPINWTGDDKNPDQNIDDTWKDYLQEWPEIPDGLPVEDVEEYVEEYSDDNGVPNSDGFKYQVTISENGEIKVMIVNKTNKQK